MIIGYVERTDDDTSSILCMVFTEVQSNVFGLRNGYKYIYWNVLSSSATRRRETLSSMVLLILSIGRAFDRSFYE